MQIWEQESNKSLDDKFAAVYAAVKKNPVPDFIQEKIDKAYAAYKDKAPLLNLLAQASSIEERVLAYEEEGGRLAELLRSYTHGQLVLDAQPKCVRDEEQWNGYKPIVIFTPRARIVSFHHQSFRALAENWIESAQKTEFDQIEVGGLLKGPNFKGLHQEYGELKGASGDIALLDTIDFRKVKEIYIVYKNTKKQDRLFDSNWARVDISYRNNCFSMNGNLFNEKESLSQDKKMYFHSIVSLLDSLVERYHTSPPHPRKHQ